MEKGECVCGVCVEREPNKELFTYVRDHLMHVASTRNVCVLCVCVCVFWMCVCYVCVCFFFVSARALADELTPYTEKFTTARAKQREAMAPITRSGK